MFGRLTGFTSSPRAWVAGRTPSKEKTAIRIRRGSDGICCTPVRLMMVLLRCKIDLRHRTSAPPVCGAGFQLATAAWKAAPQAQTVWRGSVDVPRVAVLRDLCGMEAAGSTGLGVPRL